MEGGEYQCSACAEIRMETEEKDENGKPRIITGPEFNGCDGPPLNPAPVIFDDGEKLDRCPQAIVRSWDAWQQFYDAWLWKRQYNEWPDETMGRGWQHQPAVLLDAIQLFDAELEKYAKKRRDDRNRPTQRPTIQGR